MCATLLVTPGLSVLLTYFLLNRDKTKPPNNLLFTGALFEITVLGLLAFAIGVVVYLAINLLANKKLELIDIFALVLSQAASSLLSGAALIHNPQSEFCKPGVDGSTIAKIYQLETCNLTADFWMQSGITGFVLAFLVVIAARFGRILFFRIFFN